MKKKFLVALPLALVLAFGVTACGETPETPSETLYNVTVVDGTIKGTNGWNHQSYAEGTSVTVQALAASTERGAFKNWEVAGESVGTTTEYTFTVGTADITVTAKYEAAPAAAQYVSVTVVGGTITGTDYNHDSVVKGSNVSVTAPTNKGLETFVEWRVNNEKVSASSTYEFTATEATIITAVYDGVAVSVWDGEYPESAPAGFVEDDATHTWHITTASALAYWARLVTCNNDGTDKNVHKYSVYDASSDAVDKNFQKNYHPENAWTLYLDVDVDLGGHKWDPINTLQWSLCGMTFDGNGHTISNLYVECQAMMQGTDSASGGFFGYILKDDIAIRNVTFDGARVLGGANGTAAMGVVIGYVNPSLHWSDGATTYFGTPQTIILENVNIINSIAGSSKYEKSGLFIGRSGSYIADAEHGGGFPTAVYDAANYVFMNCHASNSKVIGYRWLGGLIGYATHGNDGDIAVGGTLSITELSCTMTNVTFITTMNTNDARALPGTLASGDWRQGGAYYTNDLKANALSNIKTIDLHTGNGTVATTAEELSALLMDDAGEVKLGDVFVACDIDMTDFVGEYFTWEPTEGQNIYLLDGAQVTGLDLGNAVRLISGARNSSGSLIVTNLAGTEIGAWVVAADGKTASYQAK